MVRPRKFLLATPMLWIALIASCDQPQGGGGPAQIGARPDAGRADGVKPAEPRGPRARYVVLKAAPDLDVPQNMKTRVSVQGLLARELVRQAFLVAARDGFGLITRDEILGESAPEGESEVTATFEVRTRCVMTDQLYLQVRRIGVEGREGIWNEEIPIMTRGASDYPELVKTAEGLAREGFTRFLKRSGLVGEPNAVRGEGLVSPAAERQLGSMSFAAQYAALRDLHAAIRAEGESPELLGALIRGYANLGSQTEFLWHPMPNVFQARALLYAQRLSLRAPRSPWGPWHRAYALALAGAHRDALADLDEARKRLKAVLVPGSEPASRLRPPAWVDLIGAFCRFDSKGLAEARPGESLAPLAGWLKYLTVERTLSRGLLAETGLGVLEDSPEAFRVYDRLCDRQGIDLLHKVTLANMAALSATLADRVRGIPGLPKGLGERFKGGEDEGGTTRALIEAGRSDASLAPSWSVLGRMIREIRFTQLRRRLDFMRHTWSVPVDEFLEAARPLVIDHPYSGYIESFGLDANGPAYDQALRGIEIDPDNIELTADELLVALERIGIKQSTPLAISHADEVAEDLAQFDLAASNRWKSFVEQRLMVISPHSPLARARLIQNDWEKFQHRAGEWEKEVVTDPSVLIALARRYSDLERWDDAERCIKAHIKLVPDESAYRLLAQNYKTQGRLEEWMETLDDFLGLEEKGLGHAEVRVEIAHYLMSLKRWEEAMPYAEAAAATWARWAMVCAANCAAGMEDWERAELWIRRIAERYERALDWFLWCKQNGRGDAKEARGLLDEQFRAAVDRGEEVNPWLVGIVEILDDQSGQALKTFEKSYAETDKGGEGFLLALLADEHGDRGLRDKTWASLAAKSEQEDVIGEMGRFAALLRDSLARGEDGRLDLAVADEMIRKSSGGLPGDFYYYLGRFLELHGRRPEAIEYYRRGATAPVGYPEVRTLAAHALRKAGE